MEAEQLLAELVGGVCNAVVAVVELRYLVAVLQFGDKSVKVERPSVDVRVDAEVCGCAVEEGFRLLPIASGFKEGGAYLVYFGLGDAVRVGLELLLGGVQLVVQTPGVLGKVAVSWVRRLVKLCVCGVLQELYVGGKIRTGPGIEPAV